MPDRRSVTKLILGHNDLGDSGCEELFGFLSSNTGCSYQISQIHLNTGNRGLLDISRYLQDNTNAFVGDPDVAMVFVLAINSSRLETLSLTTNPGLTDTFVAHFFPLLSAPTFHEIHLSVAVLTHESAPHIVECITSSRCQLHTLKVTGINSASELLQKLELFATTLNDPQDKSDVYSGDDEGEAKGSIRRWPDSDAERKRILTRNSTLKHLVEKEALALLRYSRALLLRPKRRDSGFPHRSVFSPFSESCVCAASATLLTVTSVGQPVAPSLSSSTKYSPWAKLPTKLQLHILSFLAPMLSRAQRIRIFTYASSPSTLPALPEPASAQCGPGTPAASGPLGTGLDGGLTFWRRATNTYGGSMGGYANGKRMGAGNRDSVMYRRREADRAQWLKSVRCSAFELEKEEEEETR
ncbi:hypothetical protein L226DRAFT_553623 [Lentinus tigrinus ALCF2SS1-7]|uniref:RNI-like protein n=1 Tax=Lentinus tigrinus ALCF2SS1-6 TaxID=1328759 RepID=A0A5C2S5Z0_9APHY|nr:hypothetical protein L227DRAFT_593956 [Lentinus tigrinus ALCF2SS1-6]RPD73472.1 hypothetical protein L226DRAFT_553623 [Lentinus tigrinus ALCF2SS1-7]